MRVTIEEWTAHQAWDGQSVQKWAICRDHVPMVTFETREAAEQHAVLAGWEVVPS